MKYRPEIDGLRSIAVLPVIIFHSGLNLLPGGYVGVDVFFVISGYLITTIIASEADDMNFSLLRFYERRFRRILPALFVVIVSTIPLSIIWIFPKDLVDYFQSIASVGIFSSNILFWLEADYFGGASELKPLLHTWSLAVEEQFYIFFPLILMGLSRFCCRARMLGVASLLLLSFALCEWMAYKDRTTAFYLIQFRAWELLSGALISLIILQNGQKKSDFLSGLGLTMIVIPMILFDSETIFPSHWTILPVLGAVLFIGYAGEGTISKQIVSNKLFVKVGLISYSLYLWHQPIFAFAKYRSIGEPSDGLIFLLICLIFFLSWLTWKYIEMPLRKSDSNFWPSRPRVFLISSAALISALILGSAGHLMKGFPSRYPSEIIATMSVAEREDSFGNYCRIVAGAELPIHPIFTCLTGSGQSGRVAIIGDSHAQATFSTAHNILSEQGFQIYTSSYNGCPPIIGAVRLDLGKNHRCAEYNESLYDYLDSFAPDFVILISRWAYYFEGEPFDNHEGGIEVGPQAFVDIGYLGSEDARSAETRMSRVTSGLSETLDRISRVGATPVLVLPIPEAGWNVPRQISKLYVYNNLQDFDLTTSKVIYDQRIARVESTFASLKSGKVILVRPSDTFCTNVAEGRCLNSIGLEPLYFDDDHLSNLGAQLLFANISSDIFQ